MDSTVCIDEGIDEFAEFCGAGKAVAEWTARLVSYLDVADNGSNLILNAFAFHISFILSWTGR